MQYISLSTVVIVCQQQQPGGGPVPVLPPSAAVFRGIGGGMEGPDKYFQGTSACFLIPASTSTTTTSSTVKPAG